MQEVFEKILEKMEDRQYANRHTFHNDEWNIGLEQAIEIVKQEAEEYNNGFNDIVENGLPPVGKPLIVTIKDNLQGKPNELRYPVYYEKDSMNGGYRWSWRYGDFAYELVQDVSEVIAWREFPEPYQPKGE